MLWVISKILQSAETRKGLNLDICDAQERLDIRRSGGDALVGTLKVKPALNLQSGLMKNLNLPPETGQEQLEKDIFKKNSTGNLKIGYL